MVLGQRERNDIIYYFFSGLCLVYCWIFGSKQKFTSGFCFYYFSLYPWNSFSNSEQSIIRQILAFENHYKLNYIPQLATLIFIIIDITIWTVDIYHIGVNTIHLVRSLPHSNSILGHTIEHLREVLSHLLQRLGRA